MTHPCQHYGRLLQQLPQKVVSPMVNVLREVNAFLNQTPVLFDFFCGPNISCASKNSMLLKLCPDNVEAQRFLNMLLKYNRFKLLGDILKAYDHFEDRRQNIQNVTVYAAHHLSTSFQKKLQTSLQCYFNMQIRMAVHYDATLLRGVKLCGDGWQMDLSLQRFFVNLNQKAQKSCQNQN